MHPITLSFLACPWYRDRGHGFRLEDTPQDPGARGGVSIPFPKLKRNEDTPHTPPHPRHLLCITGGL